MTCPLCDSQRRVTALSLDAARYLVCGSTVAETRHLIDDLAETHRMSVQLERMSVDEQVENCGAEHGPRVVSQ